MEREVKYIVNDSADEIGIKALSTVKDVVGYSDKNNGKENGGEVFTPHWCVVDMVNMCDDKAKELGSTVLEPACGSGNILIDVLRRKMSTAWRLSAGDISKFSENTKLAVQAVYGIDIGVDNVIAARKRMYELVENFWGHVTGTFKLDDGLSADLHKVLDTNIIWGDCLGKKMGLVGSNRGMDRTLKVMNWATGKLENLDGDSAEQMTMQDIIAANYDGDEYEVADEW